MRNKQDIEDLKQDYELAVFTGKLAPRDKQALKIVYLKTNYINLEYNRFRRDALLKKNSDLLVPNESSFLEERQTLAIARLMRELTHWEKKSIKAFLQYGNLKKASIELDKNYDTLKAHYRLGIKRLRKLAKEEGWEL